jgi:hypothetical protein
VRPTGVGGRAPGFLKSRSTVNDAEAYDLLLRERHANRDAALLAMQQETAEDGQQGGLAVAFYALGCIGWSAPTLKRTVGCTL